MKRSWVCVVLICVAFPGRAQMKAQPPPAPVKPRPANPVVVNCEAGKAVINGACVQAGGEGQPCFPTHSTCYTNLHCSPAKVCVAQGGKGQHCFSNKSCTQGLTCGTNDLCDVPGTLAHACASGGSCYAGMACSSNVCVAAGLQGQPCLPPKSACQTGLVCLSNNTCAAAGAQGQPCLANNACNTGLSCSYGKCEKPAPPSTVTVTTVTVPALLKVGQAGRGTVTLREAVPHCPPTILSLTNKYGQYDPVYGPPSPTCTAISGSNVSLKVQWKEGTGVAKVSVPASVVVKRGTNSATFDITASTGNMIAPAVLDSFTIEATPQNNPLDKVVVPLAGPGDKKVSGVMAVTR